MSAHVSYGNVKIGIIFSIIFMLFSLVFISFSLTSILKAQETENWPSTSGTILSSDVERHYDSDDGTTYGAEIIYQYNLNGLNYTSSTISYGYASTSDYNSAYQLVQNYPPGKVVTVYYNPENFNEAVLIPGIDSASWAFIAFGSVFFLIGFALAIFFAIKIRQGKTSKQINITLKKTNYVPGDTIEGTVSLSLKKQEYAKSLKVAFVGEKLVEHRDSDGYHQTSYPLHKSEVVLGVESQYYTESYSFQIKIPSDILQKALNWGENGLAYFGDKQIQMGEKTIAAQKKAKKILEWGQSMGLIRMRERDVWYVEAHLDIPKKLDIRNKIEISISQV